MSLSSDERQYLKVKAAYLYYVEDKTQAEIAKMFRISRPTLIKLLKDAKSEGIVSIHIRDTRRLSDLVKLERDLCRFLGLRDVRITSASGADVVGAAAGEYLCDLLSPGMLLGIGRGATLGAAVRNMDFRSAITRLGIVALLGGTGSADANTYTMFSNSLCEILSTHYIDSCVYPIYAPLIADTPEMAVSFRQTCTVKSTFQKMNAINIALVGVGDGTDYIASVSRAPSGACFLRQLSEQHSVGNICSHFYDINGSICHTDFDDRAIAIGISELRSIPSVICAAGGLQKSEAIIGGARARLFNILVTDKQTAAAILAKE